MLICRDCSFSFFANNSKLFGEFFWGKMHNDMKMKLLVV